MASYDDDQQIDFKKLEKELNHAVDAEARYWRENDAKFRAVNQKVATYDEFKDIVKASHLKPLEKDDRLTNIKFIQPWNSQAAKKSDQGSNVSTESPQHKELSSIPCNSQAFVREWRKLNKKTAQQNAYLLEIGAEKLGEIFKPEIGFGLLGEFAHCLNCEFQPSNFGDILNILNKLSTTNRFALTVQFLSGKEKQDLKELFDKLGMRIELALIDPEIITINQFEQFTEMKILYEVKE